MLSGRLESAKVRFSVVYSSDNSDRRGLFE
jgi:hypothetical protein